MIEHKMVLGSYLTPNIQIKERESVCVCTRAYAYNVLGMDVFYHLYESLFYYNRHKMKFRSPEKQIVGCLKTLCSDKAREKNIKK